MEKIFQIRPAFDKRPKTIVGPAGEITTEDTPDYGIHCADLVLALKGDLGAVSFLMFTGWYLPENVSNFRVDKFTIDSLITPLGADLSYHSYKPMYEEQTVRPDCCYLSGNKSCYCDGSILNAEPVAALLVTDGLDAVWKYLEQYYTETFGELK